MTKRLISGLMAVWLSGFVFLFCCGAPQAQAVEINSCPLAKAGHCNKAASGESSKDGDIFRLESPGEGGLTFDCCGFLPVVFNKFKKVEQSTQLAALPAKPDAEKRALRKIESAERTPGNYQSHQIDRHGIHIKNCVFRI